MNTLTPERKARIVEMYIELTGDTECEVKRIVRYRACRGSYFDIVCGEKGSAKRDELTYYAKALGREEGYGWRVCTPEEEALGRAGDPRFTAELPSTGGHISFRKTPELLKIKEEMGASYIKWTEDTFHVEFEY